MTESNLLNYKSEDMHAEAAPDTGEYISLMKGLTLINNKHYPQFRKDKPQLVIATVRTTKSTGKMVTLRNNWVTRNALVKTAAAWRHMQRKAGIRKSQLNRYGKELRVAMDLNHQACWGRSYNARGNDLVPTGLNDVCDLLPTHQTVKGYYTGIYSAAGDQTLVAHQVNQAVSASINDYQIAHGVDVQQGFDLSMFTIPSPDADVDATNQTWYVQGDEGIIADYIDSRVREVEVEDDDLEDTPHPDSLLTLMLSDNEETSDDVIDDVEDIGDFRPYSLAFANEYQTVFDTTSVVPGQDTQIIAPLGLLKWFAAETDDQLFITVNAIVEM